MFILTFSNKVCYGYLVGREANNKILDLILLVVVNVVVWVVLIPRRESTAGDFLCQKTLGTPLVF